MTFSRGEDLTNLYYDIRDSNDFGGNAVRFLVNQTPGNSLFHVRAALDYIILSNFYGYMNP